MEACEADFNRMEQIKSFLLNRFSFNQVMQFSLWPLKRHEKTGKTLFPVRVYSVDYFRDRIEFFALTSGIAWSIGFFLIIYSFVTGAAGFLFLGFFFALLKMRFQAVSRKIQTYQALYIRGQSIPNLSVFTMAGNFFMIITLSFFMLTGSFILLLLLIS